MACRCGASRGRSQTTTRSTLPTAQPSAVSRSTTCRKQLHAVDAAIGLVAVGKQLADVAQTGRAEQCVHEGVHRDVGVGVPGEALRVVDLDAAEHQPAAVGEAVRVVAGADPKRLPRPPRRAARRPAAGPPAW